MGSLAVLDTDAGNKKEKSKQASVSKRKAPATDKKEKKQPVSEIEEPTAERKRPKRAAACSDFKEKSVHLSKNSSVIETKRDHCVEEEDVAIRLTAGRQESQRPCRRLTDFVFHNSEGIPQPFGMSEVDNLFINGLVLPLEDNIDKEKAKGIRCEGFGRIEEWAISGYEDGTPVIWISTETADYDCLKPSGSYKKFYDHFLAKATACIEVYKKLSKSSGGNPDLSLDELLAGVVRAMNGLKCFSRGVSIRDFVVTQGEFIYKQLIGLDDTSKKTDQLFVELPVLASLRDESSKQQERLAQPEPISSGKALRIGPYPCSSRSITVRKYIQFL